MESCIYRRNYRAESAQSVCQFLNQVRIFSILERFMSRIQNEDSITTTPTPTEFIGLIDQMWDIDLFDLRDA